jgi:hypothetical protein
VQFLSLLFSIISERWRTANVSAYTRWAIGCRKALNVRLSPLEHLYSESLQISPAELGLNENEMQYLILVSQHISQAGKITLQRGPQLLIRVA